MPVVRLALEAVVSNHGEGPSEGNAHHVRDRHQRGGAHSRLPSQRSRPSLNGPKLLNAKLVAPLPSQSVVAVAQD